MPLSPEPLSVKLIEEYFDNRPELFFDCMDDQIVWIGPGKLQYIEGKQNLLNAFSKEENILRFRTTQITSKLVSGRPTSPCEVLVRFLVYTFYPSGYVSLHHQRITLFWKKVKRGDTARWKYTVIHISNGQDGDSRDNILPLHLDVYEKKQIDTFFSGVNFSRNQSERLITKGIDDSTHYIEFDDIIYITAGKAKFSHVCTRNGIITVRLLISQLIELLPEQFCRVHRSYLVNVYEIVSVARNSITLKDKTEIPISPKKYHEVKSDIDRIILKKASS